MSLESARRVATRAGPVAGGRVCFARDRDGGQAGPGAVVLVDRLDNLVTELSSILEEADARAAQALQGSQPNGALEEVRSALRDIHELLNRFTTRYTGELATYDHIAQLLEMGGERGREWWDWSRVVKTAIERCATPMHAVAGATRDCWSELAERLARNSVSCKPPTSGSRSRCAKINSSWPTRRHDWPRALARASRGGGDRKGMIVCQTFQMRRSGNSRASLKRP